MKEGVTQTSLSIKVATRYLFGTLEDCLCLFYYYYLFIYLFFPKKVKNNIIYLLIKMLSLLLFLLGW